MNTPARQASTCRINRAGATSEVSLDSLGGAILAKELNRGGKIYVTEYQIHTIIFINRKKYMHVIYLEFDARCCGTEKRYVARLKGTNFVLAVASVPRARGAPCWSSCQRKSSWFPTPPHFVPITWEADWVFFFAVGRKVTLDWRARGAEGRKLQWSGSAPIKYIGKGTAKTKSWDQKKKDYWIELNFIDY